MIGCCCRLLAVSIAVVATLIGLLTSGVLSKYTPLFTWLDQYETSRGQYFKGLFPATHRDVPWGYSFEELRETKLNGHVVLVTGANSGLGYWSALHIATTDATVVIACRTNAKCVQAAERIKIITGKSVIPAELDLASFKSIRSFAERFRSTYEHLDSLLLNAGVMAPPFSLTEDGLETTIGVNHFGHFLLTQELLPLLERGAAKHGVATVTVVSSAAHYDSYPEGILASVEEMNDETKYTRAEGYGQSKLANVIFAQELAERVASKNILVNSVHPGGVATALAKHLVAVVEGFLGEAIAKSMKELIDTASWSPSDAALTQVYTSIGKTIKEKKITGKYFHPIARENKPDPHCRDKALQKRLWKLTEDFIKAH